MVVGNGAAAGAEEEHHVVLTRAVGQGHEVGPRAILHTLGRREVRTAYEQLAQSGERGRMAVEGERTADLLHQGRHAVEAVLDAGLILGLRGDEHVQVPHGVEGDGAAENDDLAVDGGEEVVAQFAEERLGELLLLVHADDEVGGPDFLEGVRNAAHHIHGPAAVRLHVDVGLGGHLHGPLQLFLSLLKGGGGHVEHHVQGGDGVVGVLRAEHEGERHEGPHGVGVAQRHEYARREVAVGLGGCHALLQHEVARRALGDERAHHARHEDEEHGAVEHVLVEQVGAVGQEYAVAHQRHGQGGGGTRAAQAEEEVALEARHFIHQLCAPRGQPFAAKPHYHHDGGHEHGTRVADERAEVDDHAHADEEVGNEKGVAHKLDVAHEGRGGGYEPVEHDAHKEGAEYALHAHELHEAGAEEHQREHEDVLHHAVVVAAEETAAYARKHVDDDGAEQHHLDHQPHPVEAGDVLLEHAAHHGQHEQCEGVGHNGAAHRNAHTRHAGEAVAQHNGIGYKRVAGIHGRHQHRGSYAVAQQLRVGPVAYGHRYGEAQQAEHQGAPPDALHVVEVHLEARQEHDVVNAHLAEELETAVAIQHMKAVRTYQYAREYHAYNRGDVQAFEQHRRKEDDAEHGEEYPGGIGDKHGMRVRWRWSDAGFGAWARRIVMAAKLQKSGNQGQALRAKGAKAWHIGSFSMYD